MGGQRLRRTFMTPRTEPLETTALVTREGVAPAPDEEFEVPVNWRTSKRHKGRVVLAGSGSTTAGLMMITSSVLDEDTAENVMGYAAGIKLARAPALLKGPHGVALKDLCTAVGIAMSTDVYFTALCKWLLPQGKNLSPKPKDCAPGVACLDRELQEVKPKIVVTFGKPAFEFMVSTRVKFLDAVGMPFWSEKYQCQVVPMQHYYYLLAKPELNERFALDLAFTAKALAEVKGVEVQRVPLNYFTIRTREELLNWVIQMLQMKVNLMCVDCEWHGRDHVDGELRSMQIAWAPGCAIYIRFRDEHRKYVFDCSYAEAGSVLGLLWNRPEFKLVGHHISADFPWAHKWLGLEFYDKAILDTEFAFQCLNEHGDRGLERMSMRYTDLGRYEFDLEVWKKENKVDASDGYGMVPDEILIPYACKDVDVPLRAYPIMRRMLEQQGMWGYYSNIMNPFVTNGFTQFALTGLPMNRVLLEEMREVYHYARKIMEQDLAGKVHVEAGELLVDYICQHLPGNTPSKQPVSIELSSRMAPVLRTCFGSLESLQAMAQALGVISEKTLEGLRVRFEHYQASISFNIRSPEMLKRWLFDVKEYTPVKSTANKEKGVSSMDWTKVMALPENRRKDMKPAVDKQTLVILCEKHKDPLLNNLLELNAVGNLCKAFLSQPERDADGQIIEEAGLIAWIASDGCVHGQFSMTETGRPRSWKPNSLNWPSGVQDRVRDGVARALKLADEKKVLPENMRQYLDGTKKILPLRACVQAPEGWCIVESDFATAELRALAYRAGDADMIEIMVGRDTQFGLVKIGDDTHSVRLSFGPKCGIRPEHQSRACILAAWKEGKLIRRVTEEELLRDERGDIKHPGHDLHWSLAEMVQGKPREVLAKSDRNAAKVGNFCIAEGELVLTHNGLKPIEHVSTCDLVWDGEEWVSHEGVVYSGEKVVIEYQGLRATELHNVWTREQGKVKHREARAQCLTLERSEVSCRSPQHSQLGDISRYSEEERRRILFRFDALQTMRVQTAQRYSEHGEGVFQQVQVSAPSVHYVSGAGSIERSAGYVGLQVPGDGPTLREGHTRVVGALQGAGNQSAIRIAASVLSVGGAEMAAGDVREERFRQGGQQWPLLPGQLAACGSHDESAQPGLYAGDPHRACSGVHAETPRLEVHGKDDFGLAALRSFTCGDFGASQSESESGLEKVRVYDIVNAGPRNRFTCQGVLVSNSSLYGATPATLERKVEADTGVCPEPGTGEKLLKALEERQPVATAFLKSLEEAPENPGFLRAASGKVRHFVLPSCSSGAPSRLFKSLKSAQGREARNFYMQESVAATAMRSENWLQAFGRRYNLMGVPMTVLYDSVCTLCPAEERLVWAKAHDICMFLANGWEYHGRILRYPIETDLNSGWSLAPAKDPRYKGRERIFSDPTSLTSEKLKPLEDWLDLVIQFFRDNERASLNFEGLAG